MSSPRNKTTAKTPPLFLLTPPLLRISQLSGQKQQNGKQSPLPLLSVKISFNDTSFHISTNCLWDFIFLSRIFVEFSLKFLYFSMCGENFQIYGVHIPRQCVDLRHFYSCPSKFKACPLVFVITP